MQTANGMAAAKAWGYDGQPPLTVDESVNGVLSVVSVVAVGGGCADDDRLMVRPVIRLRENSCRTTARFCRGRNFSVVISLRSRLDEVEVMIDRSSRQ